MSKPLCAWCLNEYSEDTFCCEKMDYENTKIKLAEAREAIKEHKRRKESWGFEGVSYDKDLWEIIKEKRR